MSHDDSTRSHIDAALGMLKDFQRATVDVVYDRLFVEGRSRMLVADEVGLGKTVVAKGVIARRLLHRLESGETEPLRVTYICSNQVIGQENVKKLDIYPQQQSLDRSVTRLLFLALKPPVEQSGLLRLNTLTPGTSFHSGDHAGHQRERKILYSLLMSDGLLRDVPGGLACLLRGWVQRKPEDWAEHLERRRLDRFKDGVRQDLPERFLNRIRALPIIPSKALSEQLGLKGVPSLYEAVVECALRLDFKNLDDYRPSSLELIRQLRKALASVCIDYIDADLYILDEFQRFRDLIDGEKESEAAVIAKQIFSKPDTKILLLSATPFKAYAGANDLESGDEHYKEFRTVLSFLMENDKQRLVTYEAHRQALFKQLLTLRPDSSEIDPSHREVVEEILRRVMCRTERLSVSERRDAMTHDKWLDGPVTLTTGDVRSFVATDSIVQALNETTNRPSHRLHPPVEFCKSAPCPLSFLSDYKLKKELKAKRDEPSVRATLERCREAWLDHVEIDDYRLVLCDDDSTAANARFSLLVREALSCHAETLLWVPPSLPYYPLTGTFADTDGFSKTLVFSGWLMVPRMAASLLSYEVERRTIGNPASVDPQEREPRKYFAPDTRRHPVPQLVYRSRSGGEPANMSNFTLLYPSLTLAGLFDSASALTSGRDRATLESQIVVECEKLFERLDLRRYVKEDGESDRWYWAAAVLLDKFDADHGKVVESWLRSLGIRSKSSSAGGDEKDTAKSLHFQRLLEAFDSPQELGLGPLPSDLFKVLAQMAIGSPSIATLRSLRSHYGGDDGANCTLALSAASALETLFNKPESIAAVRIAVPERAPYWWKVIRYCGDGCLQAVLDEYLHLLKYECETATAAVERIEALMNLRTVPLDVDDLSSFLADERKSLRCHFAETLGNQRIETEQGSKRVTGIRQNFNSPFRPFVLATTSIGQEGLDFHQYCRKVVHWNLPSNPIDLEQREGRVNRYKGHVIRLQVARKYGLMLVKDDLRSPDLWEDLFRIAEHFERSESACELIPYWHVETTEFEQYRIERIIPLYPFSQDRARLNSLLRTLAIYRLAFGQPRQSELIEHLLRHVPESKLEQVRTSLMIDLSPISYRRADLKKASEGGMAEATSTASFASATGLIG